MGWRRNLKLGQQETIGWGSSPPDLKRARPGEGLVGPVLRNAEAAREPLVHEGAARLYDRGAQLREHEVFGDAASPGSMEGRQKRRTDGKLPLTVLVGRVGLPSVTDRGLRRGRLAQ